MNTVQVRHSKTGEYVLIDLDKCTLLGASEEPFADVPIVTNLEPPHYIDCPTEIQATWRHKHYLARPSRRKYANSPSVPHSFIKAWFGPREVYYARPSRWKELTNLDVPIYRLREPPPPPRPVAINEDNGGKFRPCWSCPDATTGCVNNCPYETRLGE